MDGLSPLPPVAARDSLVIRDEYSKGWNQKLSVCQEMVSQGDKILSRIIAAEDAMVEDSYRRYLHKLYSSMGGPVICGKSRRISFLSISELIFCHRQFVSAILRRYTPKSCERVVELGCGTGSNLFYFFLNGGPQNADYMGFEYTNEGREVGSYLAGLEQRLALFSFGKCDYLNLDQLQIGSKKVTIAFTCHSIEQVTYLPERFFRDIIKVIPGLRVCLHFEPVGWQKPLAGRWRRPYDRSCERYARRLGYNQNFSELLIKAQRQGVLKILDIQRNVWGINPLNPTTLVVWEPVTE